MKEKPEDIVIVSKGKVLNGETAITYFRKGEPELKRIKIKEDEKE